MDLNSTKVYLPILEEIALWLNPEVAAIILRQPDRPNAQKILERLAQPLDCFVTSQMGDEVGYALFATNDIPAGSILFLYSGTIRNAKYHKAESGYDFTWIPNEKAAQQKVIEAAQALSIGPREPQTEKLDTCHYSVGRRPAWF